MLVRDNFVRILSTAILTGTLFSTAEAGSLATLRQERAAAYNKIAEGANTRAPFAFVRYCVTSPQACRVAEPRVLDWTADVRGLVTQVNRSVNHSIRAVNDKGRDVWQANISVGDCEDFALTKRERLIKMGVPASALRMAVATTSSGEGHAVLVVSTQEGDFVLDNRRNQILIWHQTDLTFQKIASAQDPRLWRRLV